MNFAAANLIELIGGIHDPKRLESAEAQAAAFRISEAIHIFIEQNTKPKGRGRSKR